MKTSTIVQGLKHDRFHQQLQRLNPTSGSVSWPSPESAVSWLCLTGCNTSLRHMTRALRSSRRPTLENVSLQRTGVTAGMATTKTKQPKTKDFIAGTTSPWMDTKELAVLLRISPACVHSWIHRKAIPESVISRPSGAKPGRRARLRFNRVAVERWLQSMLGGES